MAYAVEGDLSDGRAQEILLTEMGVFYRGHGGAGATGFVEQVRLAWLYAPDHVVRHLYEFLNTQKGGAAAEEKDNKGSAALSRLVAAIRRDLFETLGKPTALASEDFQHLT